MKIYISTPWRKVPDHIVSCTVATKGHNAEGITFGCFGLFVRIGEVNYATNITKGCLIRIEQMNYANLDCKGLCFVSSWSEFIKRVKQAYAN